MALDDDDQDVIRRLFRDEASKLGKGPKDPEIAHLTKDRDKLKLKYEIHDLEGKVHPHKPINWKRRGIIALVLFVLALFAAPGFFPNVAAFHSSPSGTGTPLDEVGGVVLMALFVWFFILRPKMKGNSSGGSKPAAKASAGH